MTSAFLLAVLYLPASTIAFLAYAFDKRAARRRQRRISENTLHMLALLGGWPGALLAQKWLRHKTAKKSFQRIFFGTVLVNCLLSSLFIIPVVHRLVRLVMPCGPAPGCFS
jgi:uncharacterized membrane protein YsdA (DUF1294 family)